MAYKEVGGPPGRAKSRTTAIRRKSGQTDVDRCNRHVAFIYEIMCMSDTGLYSTLSLCGVSRSEQLQTPRWHRGPRPDKAPAAPQRKGMTMKTIAKVIRSMLAKDATQQWTGQTSAIGQCSVWGWT